MTHPKQFIIIFKRGKGGRFVTAFTFPVFRNNLIPCFWVAEKHFVPLNTKGL